MRIGKKMKRLLSFGLAAITVVSLGVGSIAPRQVLASEETGGGMDDTTGGVAEDETLSPENEINLRMIVTSDIHGQMTSMDYENGRKNSHGGLEKLLTGVREARQEVREANSFTFDLGDILYDYTTENIFITDSTALQPVWQAYKMMEYDAFTLGNHDFDYGFDYIMDQLLQAGMTDQCVVSNLWKTSSGSYPFRETMMLDRMVEAEDGSRVLIRIGVIGETIPTLSQKTEVMTGQLTTEGMVKNVEKKAKKLKEEGADLIVVLAHSGFGKEEPEELDENTAYALTKLPEVDVVFAGHEHKVFPGGNGDEIVYALPNTDPENALVNGKPLVMPGSRGDQYGVVDLKCELRDENLIVVASHSEVRDADIFVDSAPEITEELYGSFLQMFQEHYTKKIATIEKGITYHNYFGMIQDNSALQLVNSAKLAYAMKFQNSPNGAAYADLPVVASSGYSYYGQTSDTDYITIDPEEDASNFIRVSGSITGADIKAMQTYHAYIVLYQITGAQLKEYIEWSASAYATLWEEPDWDYVLPPLFSAGWREDWSNFRIFDGVEYTIDPSVAPRYDVSGKKINDTSRITSLTINGVPVKPDDTMILACDKILKPTEANQDIVKKQLLGGYVSSQNFFISWLEERAKAGNIAVTADNNWSVKLPENYVFLTEGTEEASQFLAQESWYVNTLSVDGGSKYYCGNFRPSIDMTGPNLVVTPNVTIPTERNVVLSVKANDANGMKSLQYYKGDAEKDPLVWEKAPEVTDGKVTATENGMYSFRAEDNRGNITVTKVVVDNIDKEILQVPTVNTYSNRMASIKGSATPEATVYIKASGKTYSTKVEKDGSFAYALPNQPSGEKLELYVKDRAGRVSDTVTVQVKRTGPNRPTISVTIKNTHTVVKGKLKDEDALPIAMIGSAVYGTKDSLNRYRYSELYDEKLEMIKTTVKISKGVYTIKVPIPEIGETVTIYTVDSLLRASRKRSMKVVEGGPNKPTVYLPSSAERQIKGEVVPLKAKECYGVTVTVGERSYTGQTEPDGSFCVETGKMNPGDSVEVVLYDLGVEEPRKSAPTAVQVADYQEYETGSIVFDTVTEGDSAVKGFYRPNASLTLILDTSRYEGVCDGNGRFEIEVKNRIFLSSLLFVVAREKDGSLQSVAKAQIQPSGSQPGGGDTGTGTEPGGGNAGTGTEPGTGDTGTGTEPGGGNSGAGTEPGTGDTGTDMNPGAGETGAGASEPTGTGSNP